MVTNRLISYPPDPAVDLKILRAITLGSGDTGIVTVTFPWLASVVIGALPAVAVSNSVHAALVAIGGVVIAVERYLQGNPAAVAAKAVKK